MAMPHLVSLLCPPAADAAQGPEARAAAAEGAAQVGQELQGPHPRGRRQAGRGGQQGHGEGRRHAQEGTHHIQSRQIFRHTHARSQRSRTPAASPSPRRSVKIVRLVVPLVVSPMPIFTLVLIAGQGGGGEDRGHGGHRDGQGAQAQGPGRQGQGRTPLRQGTALFCSLLEGCNDYKEATRWV